MRASDRSWPCPKSGGDIQCSTPKREGSRLFRTAGVQTARSLGETARMAQEIRKKSYRRACRRGFRDGTASYRGGEITSLYFLTGAQQSGIFFSFTTTSRSRPCRAATTTRRPRRAGNLATALSVLSWNAGGLSAQQWHELQERAVTCPYHALCIQETHWSSSSQFRARGWHVMTSGYPSATDSSSTRSAGVMVMLHPSIPVQDIRWSVGTPGRSHMVHFSFKD